MRRQSSHQEGKNSGTENFWIEDQSKSGADGDALAAAMLVECGTAVADKAGKAGKDKPFHAGYKLSPDSDSNFRLEHIPEQNRQTGFPAESAGHIRSPGIAAAFISNISVIEGLGENNARIQRA